MCGKDSPERNTHKRFFYAMYYFNCTVDSAGIVVICTVDSALFNTNCTVGSAIYC